MSALHNDPAMGDLGYAREPHDFYETPAWCTEVLLPELPRIEGAVWECAAGKGAISEVLKKRFTVVSSDIVDYGYPDHVYCDFLACDTPLAPNIVTNPPYDRAEEFLRHAIAITKPAGTVAMLFRNEFDCAKRR
jgi:hypothetical protein